MFGSSDSKVGGARARRVLALTAAATAACFALAGCQSNKTGADTSTASDLALPDPGKAAATKVIDNINVGYPQQVSTMDPLSGTAGYFLFGTLSLETLLQVKPDGTLGPWLAESWSKPSPTEYVYNLRKGVKFWDGTELTADDVVYSLLRTAGPGLGKAGFFAAVKSIVAKNAYTVIVTLNKPDATWTNMPGLFYTQIYEKKWTQDHLKKFGQPGTLVMGTGPWQLVSLDPTKQAVLKANPSYWGGEPPIKQLTMKFYSSDTSLALAVRAGEVDLVPTVAQPDSFRASSGAKVTTVSMCSTSMFTMNTSQKPWDDIHVRKAVAYALDKPALLKATGGAAVSTLDYIIAPPLLATISSPSEASDALKSVTTYPHSIEKAKAELAQSSVPNGFSGEIVSTNDQGALRITQALMAQMKAIGINLKLKSVSLTEQIPLIIGDEKKRPIGFISTGACSPDPTWDDLFVGKGPLNEAAWHPADVDALLASGKSGQDSKQRLADYVKIVQRVNEEVPYVPLFLEGTSFASNKYDWLGYGSFWQNNVWALNIKAR